MVKGENKNKNKSKLKKRNELREVYSLVISKYPKENQKKELIPLIKF